MGKRRGSARTGTGTGTGTGLAAAAALTASALLLSACGGASPAAPPSATPRATPSPARPSSSGTPPASAVSGGSTTRVRIGRFTQEFRIPPPVPYAQAQVLRSFRDAQVLWIQSLVAGHTLPLMKDYVVGAALGQFLIAARADSKAGMEPAGTDLMFDIRVTALSKTGATVTSCDYDAHFASLYRGTGKLVPGSSPPTDQDYIFESWQFVPRSKHWALAGFTVATLPSPAARLCQP